MNKIINGVATEYEMPEQRYLKCETLTGEWWYKDMKTGKDLPLFTTPIPEREETKITYETGNIKELERINIDLLQELDKHKNIAEEIQTELFDIKDMIYKPETREENIPIQRKISEVIKKLEKLKGE